MSSIIFLLILLLVWFFLIAPFINMIKMFDKAQKNAQQRARQQGNNAKRNSSQKQSSRKKKKIDANIGEYVEFTETKTAESDSAQNQSEAHNSNRQQPSEPQITDVSWEDIPGNTQR